MNRNKLKEGIRNMFKARDALHEAFEKKPFTPDGRMVGDIGEAIAEIDYMVDIDKTIRKDWDGVYKNKEGKPCFVQVKTTQKEETYLKQPPSDGYLLVFKIFPDRMWKPYYNGPIMKVWNSKHMTGKGKERFITLKNLEKISEQKNFIPKRKL